MSDAAAHATLTLAKSKSGFFEDGSRRPSAFDPLAAQPGRERVEPVLQHEQLEVAAGAVERRARRERA